VYTQRTLDIGGGGDRDTYSCLVFGNTGYESQVNTVTFSDLDSWQYQSDFLNRGWFLDWLVAPYTFSFAGHFWDLWIMIPLAGIYLRCRNSTPLLVLFVIFGGIGGIFALMLSPFATAVIEGFCLFSLASILYKVWR
jgi:hypothetical protein